MMKPPSPSPTDELLVLRLAGPRWSSSLEQQLRGLEPGGIVLAGPLPSSPETLFELLGKVTRCLAAPPILALEAEGGGVDPLKALLPPLPSPRALGQKGARFVRQAGELVGEALKLLGFNTDFGVVLDFPSGFAAESLGAGTFSADPRVVAECGGLFVEGLSRHKILACAKHFPGLGGVTPVPGGELPVCGRSMAELWRANLIPYRQLLPRFPLVLMSAAAYTAYDFDYPRSAVLSPQVVEGLLRAKLGYRGVVVAPHLEAQPVRGSLDVGSAAAQSLSAGCDMLLVEGQESWQAMHRGIEEAVTSGAIPREGLEQSLARIHAVKKGLALPKGAFSRKAWGQLARRVEEFNSGYQEVKRA
jgi:beta-N-acetylhexosaminidase